MTKVLGFVFALLIFQDEIPFKSADEFKVKVDLKFKTKPNRSSGDSFTSSGVKIEKTSTKVMPFLTVKVVELKFLQDELKILATDSQGKTLFRKKAVPGLELNVEMGFVDEMKNNTIANGVVVYFLSAEKSKVRKITFQISETGVFTVNDHWHGQF